MSLREQHHPDTEPKTSPESHTPLSSVNTEAKVLITAAASLIREVQKRFCTTTKQDLPLGCKNETPEIQLAQHGTVSIDTGKASDKIQHLPGKKQTSTKGIEGHVLTLIKAPKKTHS